jgi:hypothetical protein
MGLGEDVNHVGEFVSCWRTAVIECAFDGAYQKGCILSVYLVLVVYAMCSIFLCRDEGTGKYLTDETRPAHIILSILLGAMALGKLVELLRTDLRYTAMIQRERRMSVLIGLE